MEEITHGSNFERECVEESCNNEELAETTGKDRTNVFQLRETYSKCVHLVNEDDVFRSLSNQVAVFTILPKI